MSPVLISFFSINNLKSPTCLTTSGQRCSEYVAIPHLIFQLPTNANFISPTGFLVCLHLILLSLTLQLVIRSDGEICDNSGGTSMISSPSLLNKLSDTTQIRLCLTPT